MAINRRAFEPWRKSDSSALPIVSLPEKDTKMIAGCGTCGAEMEHLGTFQTSVYAVAATRGELHIQADIFRCRNCLRIIVWET